MRKPPRRPAEQPRTLSEFQAMFSTEAACADYMERVRWPDGFTCPHCGVRGEPYRFAARPEVLRCRSCQKDASLTAGTVMHKTKQPLTTWFWAAYLVSTQTPGMSALQFQRQLGISRYETAFQLLHKLRAGMLRPDHDSIGDEWPVEVDEAFVGGKTKGKGRGVTDAPLVIAAVEVRTRVTPKKGRRTMSKEGCIPTADEIRWIFEDKVSRRGEEIAGAAVRMMRDGRNFEEVYGFDAAPAHSRACEILKRSGYDAQIVRIGEGGLVLRVTVPERK